MLEFILYYVSVHFLYSLMVSALALLSSCLSCVVLILCSLFSDLECQVVTFSSPSISVTALLKEIPRN